MSKMKLLMDVVDDIIWLESPKRTMFKYPESIAVSVERNFLRRILAGSESFAPRNAKIYGGR